jgi:hypothetical protein
MNLLYDLILMVYADDVIDDHEVAFCEDVVTQFGLKKDLVSWLALGVERGTPPPPMNGRISKRKRRRSTSFEGRRRQARTINETFVTTIIVEV